MSVARSDRAFVDQLFSDKTARLTKDDRQMMHAQLTTMALEEGDTAAAVSSIRDNMTIDPTQSMLVELINEVALKDRVAADRLILQQIETLTSVTLIDSELVRARASLVLRWMVFS